MPGLGLAARGGDGVQGGLRALVKGTGRGLRRDKDPGDLAGDLGRPLWSREERGEEGADARARGGRERPWPLVGGEGRRGLGAGRRAVRGERVGELGRACLLGRARGRAGRIAGQAGLGSGPQGERERRERAGLPEWISGRV